MIPLLSLKPFFILGGMVGQRLSDHPDVRKLGFTGSTPIGKQIMKRFDSSFFFLFFFALYVMAVVMSLHRLSLSATLGFSCALSNLKKVSLELGGKSPLIIFSDCDLDKAVRMVREDH